MNSRFQVALVAGAMLVAGPVVAATHSDMHKHHKGMMAQKSAGGMTTDQLNDKALADAKGTMMPASTTAAPMGPPMASGTGMTGPAPSDAPMSMDSNAPKPMAPQQ